MNKFKNFPAESSVVGRDLNTEISWKAYIKTYYNGYMDSYADVNRVGMPWAKNFFIYGKKPFLKVLSSHLNWGARLHSFDPL